MMTAIDSFRLASRLDTLRRWRFFPALRDGRPVESTQDIRVHFNVS